MLMLVSDWQLFKLFQPSLRTEEIVQLDCNLLELIYLSDDWPSQ